TRPCAPGQDPLKDPTRITCQRPYEGNGARLYDGSRKPTRSILGLTDQEINAITAPPGYIQLANDAVFQARGISVTYTQGTALEANQQFLLAIIRHAWGDRPIFFASTTNIQFDMQLYPYVARQGLAFKLVTPEESRGLLSMTPEGAQYNPIFGAYANVNAGERLLAGGGVMLRHLEDRKHWPDDPTPQIPL